MKLSAKPISSPGRAEKFPPPLMRFLRTNVGSRSRGRLRSSPMFVRKKTTAAAVETQEPSSPKVTCMGQVRVRRSSKQPGSSSRRTGAPTRKRCKLIRNSLLFRPFPGKIKAKSFAPVWRKLVPFFQVGFCRKGEIKDKQSNIESKFEDGNENFAVGEDDLEVEDQEFERKAKAFVAMSSSTPPKNALLLTRCRSAPYRSSSLASRFWGGEEAEEKQGTEPRNRGNCSPNEKPDCERESVWGQEAILDSESGEKLEFLKELESSIAEFASIEDKDGDFGGSGRPLILTRCKSEPARTGEKLDPEMSFLRNRRLGIVDSCSPSVL